MHFLVQAKQDLLGTREVVVGFVDLQKVSPARIEHQVSPNAKVSRVTSNSNLHLVFSHGQVVLTRNLVVT